MQNKIDSILTKLIKEELNKSFINENKLYPSNIIFNLTKKLGDNSDDTLNKLAVFGLFRQAAPFNTVKDINQLSSLEQLNELFDKWKESALQGLITTDGPLKGNKTAALTYLEAYIKNIKSLGNNAKPFSYRDAEKSLIDVANNSGWVKSNDNSTQTHSIESPDKQDILFEDNTVLIVKAPTQAKCIMYGKGYSWCISQSQLNSFMDYRLEYGATIYFVLNKTKPKEDKERVCVVMVYPDKKYGISDATNKGDRWGDMKGDFSYVEKEFPWLKGKEKYFTETNVTKGEKDYGKFTEQRYKGEDLGSYIINTAKQIKINGEEVDPLDFFKDYLRNLYGNNAITIQQFNTLTEPMKSVLVEVYFNLTDNIIEKLSSNLKVRYAVNKYKVLDIETNEISRNLVNLNLYTDDEIKRFIVNLKGRIDDFFIIDIIKMLPIDRVNNVIPELINITPDVADLQEIFLNDKFKSAPNNIKYNIIKQLLPVLKDTLNGDDIIELYDILNYDDKYVYNLILQLITLLPKEVLNDMVVSFISRDTEENGFNISKLLIPRIKDILTPDRLHQILEDFDTYDTDTLNKIIPVIISLIGDKLNNKLSKVILFYTDDVDKKNIKKLINQYKQPVPVNENKLNIILKKLINEELKTNYNIL